MYQMQKLIKQQGHNQKDYVLNSRSLQMQKPGNATSIMSMKLAQYQQIFYCLKT